MKKFALVPALSLLGAVAGCTPEEEESVEERFRRTEAAIENTAAALEAQVENEVKAAESALENQADAFENRVDSIDQAETNLTETNTAR